MKFQLDQYNRNTPDDELIADVKRVALLLGKDAVTIDEQNEHGHFHATTLTRRFGSWMTALEKAGLLQTRTPMNIPEEDLFGNLEEVWIRLGRQPRYQEVRKPISRYGASTYEKRFGGWRNALRAFVTYINNGDDSTEFDDPTASLAVEQTAKPRGTRHINRKLLMQVLMRDEFTCKLCGDSKHTNPLFEFHIDHIIPWSKDGPTVLENLRVLCSRCNLLKGDLDLRTESEIEAQNV